MSARRALAGLALLVASAPPVGAADSTMALGRKVFAELAQPPCRLCHILKSAGADGKVGPSLDELKPDVERARQVVRDGSGVMPPYREKLAAEEIDAVARYVAEVAGKAD